ncbi:[FeFe] hydrogenase H-cluster radical SAM maturase HydE [Bacteroidota bacterium]
MRDILEKTNFSRNEIIGLLKLEGEDKTILYEKSAKIKAFYVKNIVYFRGLIEFSNICGKNCNYCGIRTGNDKVERYNLSDIDIINAAQFAYDNNYGSVVLQAGELQHQKYTKRITNLVHSIKQLSNNKLGITLSLGEQEREVYQEWFDAGAHRYLLRIETSNEELYKKLHPEDGKHLFKNRMNCLNYLQEIGYQTGTGVMIGLPFQTYEDLANDLLFMKDFDIDMVGMGPYIEHYDTPFYQFRNKILSLEERFELSLKMIAILRIMMKDINIAAATALQAIDPVGREKAIKIGANVIMPNITPGQFRDKYKLYNDKPCTTDEADDCKNCMGIRISLTNNTIGFGKWGDSKHYFRRKDKTTY